MFEKMLSAGEGGKKPIGPDRRDRPQLGIKYKKPSRGQCGAHAYLPIVDYGSPRVVSDDYRQTGSKNLGLHGCYIAPQGLYRLDGTTDQLVLFRGVTDRVTDRVTSRNASQAYHVSHLVMHIKTLTIQGFKSCKPTNLKNTFSTFNIKHIQQTGIKPKSNPSHQSTTSSSGGMGPANPTFSVPFALCSRMHTPPCLARRGRLSFTKA